MENSRVVVETDVGPIAGGSCIAILIRWAELDKNRPAGLEGGDTRNFPSAEDGVENTGPSVSDPLAAAKRQFVDVANDQPLADVEVGTAAVGFQISGVLSDIASAGVVYRVTVV